MPDPVSRTENDALIEALRQGADATLLWIGDGNDQPLAPGLPGEMLPVATVPTGTRIESIKKYLDEYRLHPERRRGTTKLGDLDSFIAHANRYRDHGTVVFADDTRGQMGFTVVYDYHPAITSSPPEIPEMDDEDDTAEAEEIAASAVDTNPRWLQHRATVTLRTSEPYEAWKAIDGEVMTGAELAEFLEDRVLDIMPPPTIADDPIKQQMDAIGGRPGGANDIMGVSKNFKLMAERQIGEVRNLSSGEVELAYTETHKGGDGQAVKVPTCFVVGIPIFHNEPPYRLLARLRYRAGNGGVKWIIKLHRLDLAEDDAFRHARARVARDTTLPVLIGTPEPAAA